MILNSTTTLLAINLLAYAALSQLVPATPFSLTHDQDSVLPITARSRLALLRTLQASALNPSLNDGGSTIDGFDLEAFSKNSAIQQNRERLREQLTFRDIGSGNNGLGDIDNTIPLLSSRRGFNSFNSFSTFSPNEIMRSRGRPITLDEGFSSPILFDNLDSLPLSPSTMQRLTPFDAQVLANLMAARRIENMKKLNGFNRFIDNSLGFDDSNAFFDLNSQSFRARSIPKH